MVRRWLPADIGTSMSRGVTASGWATSTLSSRTLIESIGAVDEKFATTRTGEPTVLAVGETILIFCAPAMMDTKRNGRSVRLRANSKGKSSNIFFNASPKSHGKQPENKGWWTYLASEAKEQ